jgi:hypothetical protein
MLGKKGTGKSTLIKDIFFHKRKELPDGIAMLGTADANDDFSGMIPEIYIYEGYHRDALQAFVNRQKKINKERKAKGLPKKFSFVLIDDCGFDKDFTKDPILRMIFMNGRHYGIFFIFALQYCMGIPPDMRSQIDYVFILKENLLSNRKRLHQEYAGIIPDFGLFGKVLDRTTENRCCLVVKNNSLSNKVDECLYWYKADLHPTFRVGDNAFWHYHLLNYNPHHEEDTGVESDSEVNTGGISWTEAKKAARQTKKKKPVSKVRLRAK